MRDWTYRMEAAGATVLNGDLALICHETRARDGLSECRSANSWQMDKVSETNKTT